MSRAMRHTMWTLYLLWGTLCSAQDQVLSNGTILATVDTHGTVVQIQWSQVGAYGQIRSGGAPRWGIVHEEEILWLDDDGWTHEKTVADASALRLTTAHHRNNPNIEAITTVEFDAKGDRVRMSIAIVGVEPMSIIWDAGLDPNAAFIPEGAPSPASRPHAAGRLYPTRSLVHARTESTGPNLRDADTSAKHGAEYWRAFGAGTWLSVQSRQQVLESGVCAEGAPEDGITEFGYGTTRSRLVLKPDDGGEAFHAEVVLGFAPDFEPLEAAMTTQFEVGTRSKSPKPRQFSHEHETIQSLAGELSSRLVALQNKATGAIIVGPPREAGASTVDVATASGALYALSMSNRNAESRALADFLLAQINMTTDSVRPLGSVSANVYVAGEPATPHYEVELLPAASVIWGIIEHAEEMDHRKRRAYLESVGTPLEFAADFLESWSRPLLDRSSRLGQLNAEDRNVYLRDIAAAQLGLNAASRLFAGLGREIPDTWTLALNRSRRLTEEYGYFIHTPWDIRAIPDGGHVSLRESGTGDGLEAHLAGLETREQRLNALLSVGYQLRRVVDGVRIQRGGLANLAEGPLNEGDFAADSGQSDDIARLLTVLYQSYQSRP